MKKAVIILTISVFFAAGGFYFARGGVGVSVNANGGRQSVGSQHGVCNNVLNNSATRIFVPDNTWSEWSTARNYISAGSLSGVTLGECNSCDPWDGSYEVKTGGGCTNTWESYDTWYTYPSSRCTNECANQGAEACSGIGGGGGPYCNAYQGTGCWLAYHPPLGGSMCGYR